MNLKIFHAYNGRNWCGRRPELQFKSNFKYFGILQVIIVIFFIQLKFVIFIMHVPMHLLLLYSEINTPETFLVHPKI